MSVFEGQLLEELTELVSRYPDRRSAALPALHLAQRAVGSLTEAAKEEVAERLGLHPAFIESVATFYSLYLEDKPGRHVIQVCTTLSCMLLGADQTVDRFREELGCDIGGVAPDGEASLFIAECLGACQHAPVARVDGRLRFRLTADQVPALLDELRPLPPGSPSPDLGPELTADRALELGGRRG
ncbi:MAG: NADH-quinone oxidoreductase subunit NuoE family protein [Candidatus Dormibacteria bacterium]